MKRAFTLVELIIYMGIFLILLLVLTQLFSASLNLHLETQSKSVSQEDGRFILSRLAYDVGRADSLSFPTTLGQDNNNLQIVISGVTYQYVLSGNNLTLVATQSGTTLSNDVLNSTNTTISNFHVMRIGTSSVRDTVQISFTVTSVTSSTEGRDVKNYTTVLGLR